MDTGDTYLTLAVTMLFVAAIVLLVTTLRRADQGPQTMGLARLMEDPCDLRAPRSADL